MDRARLAYVTAAAVGAGTAVFFIWWWRTEKQKPRPPSTWRKVGEVSDLVAYPIKSLGPIRLNSMEATILGLKSGWMRDRSLMVIDLESRFVTARQIPSMVQVSPSFSNSVLTLSAPGMVSVSVNLAELRGKNFRVAMWGQVVSACDCGEEIAQWLSRFLLHEDTGLRLVYYPLERPAKPVRNCDKVFSMLENNDMGGYADNTSYSLVTEASVADLNSRLDETISSQQFRMNIVVKGSTPYEEEKWDWIKIGNLILRNVRPCTRCILTTVNPETGQKNSKAEPLVTLKSYKQCTDPHIRSLVGNSPIMGIHLGLRGPNGTIQVGDSVYLGISDEKPKLSSPAS
ncbi:mitochondrial amidoxime-reducing component 1-like [Linepithema humile]|uniref:mitochondrial amidoxime-reducing component 1-like n=1 Tax=Linepithema humile TaxID=83485 RepID=UPI00062377AE|nr:PREDICTED: mitochondrial amidoxime-reducing component 1-like [Linepithema humile]